jgi:hypothetical protein
VVTAMSSMWISIASPGAAPFTAIGPVTPLRFSSTQAADSSLKSAGSRYRPVKQSSVSTMKLSPWSTAPIGV